jgi:hypothetical protein
MAQEKEKKQNQSNKKNQLDEQQKSNKYMGYYIPHRLWISITLFFGLLYALREKIIEGFSHSVELNTIIAATVLIVIFLNISNILKFHAASKLINKITDVIDNSNFEEYDVLQEKMMKKGNVLDSFAMRQVLKTSFNKNKLLFDDKSAILIKSKVGRTATSMRSGITFLTGILVMLGLIGTFWGMLDTLKSVGDVLAALGSSLDSEGGVAALIGSIAKPISGMGAAFSASLFGLAGSLFGNILNNFISQGIDKFIVDFGYWVDTHIPIQQKTEASFASSGVKINTTGRDNNALSEMGGAGSNDAKNSPLSAAEMSNNGVTSLGMNAIAQEIKRSTQMQEHFMKQIMEFTSTQLYAANTLKQSLLALNSVQTKGVQIAHTQKTLAENNLLETQRLKQVIIQIANHFDGINIDDSTLYTDNNVNLLQEKLDLLKQEFMSPDFTVSDEIKEEQQQKRTR